MDSKNRNEKRRASKIPTCRKRRQDSRKQIEKSRTFKESQNEEESSACRNIKKNTQKVKSIYSPLKEQLQVLVEYINILERKGNCECVSEISFIVNILDNLKKYCEILLNYKSIKEGKNG